MLTMKLPTPVTHVIFDMDGLLLDTERLYTVATNNVAKPYGKVYTWEMKVKVMGTLGVESARLTVDMLGLPITVEDYLAKMDEQYKKLFPTAELLPGAERLIRHLHQHKIPIAIATSSKPSSYNLKTASHKELFSLFHHVVTGSDNPEVKRGKPAPDVFLVTMQKFSKSLEPKDVLIFEDSPNGVKAALASGAQCIMVPDVRLIHQTVYDATQCIGSLNHFQPELYGLPPFTDVSN